MAEEIYKPAFINSNNATFRSLGIIIQIKERLKERIQNIIVQLCIFILWAIIVGFKLHAIDGERAAITDGFSLHGSITAFYLLDKCSLTITCITGNYNQFVFQVRDIVNEAFIQLCLDIGQIIKTISRFWFGDNTTIAMTTLAIKGIKIIYIIGSFAIGI